MASAMILHAQEKERARVARELHDETGQALTLLLVRLQLVADRITDGSQREDLADLRELVVQTLDGVRRIVVDLGPTVLDELGLVSAVEWLADRVSVDGLRVETNLSLQEAPPRPVALALFRVAQEALTNAVRHAHAASVSVRLEAVSGMLRLVVSDDGRGFDVDAAMATTEESVGLYGMSERMALVGGDLAIESSARGTLVAATVPVPLLTR
jgi:signal transduction histidine kinase